MGDLKVPAGRVERDQRPAPVGDRRLDPRGVRNVAVPVRNTVAVTLLEDPQASD